MKKFRDPETGKVFEDIEAAMDFFCYESLRQCNKCNFNGGNCRYPWIRAHPVEAARLMGYEVIDEKEDNMDKQDKPLSEWTLGEVKAECSGRDYCSQCPLYGYTCAIGEGDPAQIPSEYLLDTITPRLVDTEREGLGPSPTRETEAPGVDVGAGSKPARPRLAEVLGVEEDEEWESCSAVCRIHNGFREIKGANGWEKADNERFLTALISHPDYIKRLPRPRLTESEIAIMRAVKAKYVTSLGNRNVGLWGEKPDFDADTLDPWNLTFSYHGEQFITAVSASLFPSVKPGECIGLEETET